MQQAEINTAEAETSEGPAGTDAAVLQSTPLSLLPGTELAALASRLDRMELSRSSAVQEARAAEATLRARGLDRYPQLVPTASAPFTGEGTASLGLNIEQLIWGAGRNRAQITEAELRVMEAHLIAWRERNKAVNEGLAAFVEIIRSETRLDALSALAQELEGIAGLLQTRLDGGVADRGEVLRMTSAQQEVERRIVFDRSALRRAVTEFLRLLPDDAEVPKLPDLAMLAQQCQRVWPDAEAPAEALARTNLSLAEAAADVVRARRFPKLVLAAGSNYSSSGWAEPAVGLRLDASDMLGLGRKGDVEAADASVRAAAADYVRLRTDIRAEMVRLEADYAGLQQDADVLENLLQRNDETLTLFEEQLEVGAAPLVDAIDLQGERTDTRIALIDVQADMVLNCLQSSQLRGLLAPFGNSQ